MRAGCGITSSSSSPELESIRVLDGPVHLVSLQGGRSMKRFLLALSGLGLFAAAATAQDATRGAQAPPKEPEIKREEVIVVSASKTESTIINAPATMSVITPDILATTAAQNYGD